MGAHLPVLVTALNSPVIFARFTIEEADAVLRHLERPDPDLPRAQVALVLYEQLKAAVREASSKTR